MVLEGIRVDQVGTHNICATTPEKRVALFRVDPGQPARDSMSPNNRIGSVMPALSAIAFDADDTLWHNERFFRMTHDNFAALLADYAGREHLEERLL